MNIAIFNNTGASTLKLVGDVLLVNLGDDLIVPNEAPPEFLESFAATVIAEIGRIKSTSLEHARNFVDFSTFDEIACVLRSGKSHLCDLHPGFLAQVFCHISTT